MEHKLFFSKCQHNQQFAGGEWTLQKINAHYLLANLNRESKLLRFQALNRWWSIKLEL